MPVAVVTGAGQGLGRADCLRLAEDGFDVMCLDLNIDAARETAELCGGTAFQLDVTDRAAVFAVADQISECFALVNNAGIWNFPSILDVTEQQMQSVIEVNVKGIVWCCQAFVPKMRAGGGGSIVNKGGCGVADENAGARTGRRQHSFKRNRTRTHRE